MRVAFDIDGVISKAPVQLGNLMYELVEANNQVVVITGAIGGNPTIEQRLQQLRMLGVYQNDHFKELVIINGDNQDEVDLKKALYCRDDQVDMLFEDSETVIQKANDIAVKTVVWLIKPTDFVV